MLDNTDWNSLEDQIIKEFSKTIEQFGLNPLEARLFSYLYLSNKALTLDEMSEGLGKSKTAINTNIRSLKEMQLVDQVWKKGIRKDLYQASSSLYKTFMTFYIKRWMEITRGQKRALEFIQDEVTKFESEKPSTDRENFTNRLKEIITFHEQIESVYREVRNK